MKKKLSCLTTLFLLFMSKLSFAEVKPFEETKQVLQTGAQVVYYIIGAVVAILALLPFVLGGIMGWKSYQNAKESREGRPEMAGIKTFVVWVLVTGVVSFFAYYFINTILDNQLGVIIRNLLDIGERELR